MAQKEWPTEEKQQLLDLHGQGKTPSEICEIMGKTMGAVTGKMSRMNLTDKKARAPQGRVFSGQRSPRKPQAALLEAVQVHPPAGSVVHAQCRWPLGEPGETGFRFCDSDVLERRTPYCPAHKAVAYAKPRTALEESI